jgi:hypothetical protein
MDRIQVVISQIERHKLLLSIEVSLDHLREAHEAHRRALAHFEKKAKFHWLQEYHNFKSTISPKSYDDKLDSFNRLVREGSRDWLMRNSTFIEWLDATNRAINVLWLKGKPGSGLLKYHALVLLLSLTILSGKTVLAGTVIEKTRTAGRTIFAFLSFQNSTSALSVLHSLIFQLASEDDDLKAAFRDSSLRNLKDSITVAVSFLKTLLDYASPVYIVIDGMDEIDEVERAKLLRQLLDLSKICVETKILISSRPEADIATILAPESTPLGPVDDRDAITQFYVTERIKEWFHERKFLPEEEVEITGLLFSVVTTANGMLYQIKPLYLLYLI